MSALQSSSRAQVRALTYCNDGDLLNLPAPSTIAPSFEQISTVDLTHHFLIAMPSMVDPNFAKSLTYICEHNDQVRFHVFDRFVTPIEAPKC